MRSAGARVDTEIEDQVTLLGWKVLLFFLVVCLVAAGLSWMWKKIKRLEWALVRLQNELDVLVLADFSNSLHEMELTWSMQMYYTEDPPGLDLCGWLCARAVNQA